MTWYDMLKKKRTTSIHLLSIHFMQSLFSLISRTELDEAETLTDTACLAHNLCTTEGNVLLFENLPQISVIYICLQLSNI